MSVIHFRIFSRSRYVLIFCFTVEEVIKSINALLVDDATPEELVQLLNRPEANLPVVIDNVPVVHHRELTKEKKNVERVGSAVYFKLLV